MSTSCLDPHPGPGMYSGHGLYLKFYEIFTYSCTDSRIVISLACTDNKTLICVYTDNSFIEVK